MRVKDKVALITGGAGGIGAETARTLAREGAQVVIADVSDNTGAQIAREIGGTYFRLDVSSEEQWQDLADGVVGRYGRIDVLVNAAGIEGDLVNAGLKTSLAEWRRVMAVNLDGTFLGCRTVLPKMLEKGAGSIVNISSIVSFFATPTALSYGASKAAVEQLTRSFAQLGGTDGKRIRCNSVHPGVIKTRMTDNILGEFAKLSGVSTAEAEAAVNANILFKRRGEPGDVASLILFLASEESSYITGSAFQVDGGWHLVSAG